MPLFGTADFGLIKNPYLPLELAAFFDSGVAWTADEAPAFEFARHSTERIPVFSAGGAARIRIGQYFVLEFFEAYPFQRPSEGWDFGFQFTMGGW